MIPNEGDVLLACMAWRQWKARDRRGPFMTLNCPRIWIWRKPDESYLLPQNMDKMLVFSIYDE